MSSASERRAAMEAALGARILIETPLAGGCINHAAKLETSRGAFFAKWSDGADFDAEAACLEALRGGSLAVPQVIAASSAPAFLILELLEPGVRAKDFDERLGRGLAELHRRTAPAFGFERDTYCGATRQPNAWTERWSDFYREHRLGHQLRLMRDARLITDPRPFDRVLSRLEDLLGDEEAPALIHGDLWSGNLHVTADGLPALIDPSSYYAHREAELGMMTLFGGFGARVYSSYEEAYPLAPAWRERNALYQLYHLMNHANLFGGGYAAQATAVAKRFG